MSSRTAPPQIVGQKTSAATVKNSQLACVNHPNVSASTKPNEPDDASAVLKHLQSERNGSHAIQAVSFRGPNGTVGKRDIYTHHFHRYPAKLFWRIPAAILDALDLSKGSVVVDPFCGSGTVLVEALRRGLTAIGYDTNPIAERISKAKTTPLSREILENRLETIVRSARRMRRFPTDEQLPPFWFAMDARKALCRASAAVQLHAGETDYRNFFEVTLSSIVRECSLADPEIPPPVKMRPERAEVAGQRYRRALTRAMTLQRTDVFDRFEQRAVRNIDRLCGYLAIGDDSAQVNCCSALNTGLSSDTADIVITSPPYCGGAQKYTRTFRLELMLMGYSESEISKIDKRDMGTERPTSGDLPDLPRIPPDQRELVSTVAERNHQRWKMLVQYMSNLEKFARELRRILKPDGHAFVSLGTGHFAGLPIDLSACFLSLAEANGLQLAARLEDLIPSRGMITKRHQSAALIHSDDILWLRSSKN